MSQLTNKIITPEEQISRFPATRYMGSKSKLLDYIWNVSKNFEFESVLDLFSGSGVVSYMYKAHGKRVISNDYMTMGAVMTKALVENNSVILPLEEAKKLIADQGDMDDFVQEKFRGIYFSDEDNLFIDTVRTNIKKMDNQYKQAIAMEALIRSCVKKRAVKIDDFTIYGKKSQGVFVKLTKVSEKIKN